MSLIDRGISDVGEAAPDHRSNREAGQARLKVASIFLR
jgi:hypothetical protein